MRAVFSRFVDVLRDGVSMLWIAPVIAAIIIIPEFIQHIAEIRIGMFESKDAFNSLADDPRRMVWGYLKIAGLLIGILASVRFWGARVRGEKWWNLRGVAWKNLGIAILLMAVIGIPGLALEPVIGAEARGFVDIGLSLATLPLLALLVAGLSGDTSTGLIGIFKSGWLPSLRILVFAAAVWVPLQWLHGMNHEWAMGQSSAIVWALMIFDSLVVGLLALLAGTAIHHGYALKAAKDTA